MVVTHLVDNIAPGLLWSTKPLVNSDPQTHSPRTFTVKTPPNAVATSERGTHSERSNAPSALYEGPPGLPPPGPCRLYPFTWDPTPTVLQAPGLLSGS